jgi:alkyl hydroperoxide reductase subunit AhpC
VALRIGDVAPNFTAESTHGLIDFHAWLGDGWGVFFSHTRAFTAASASELRRAAGLAVEFGRRGCKLLALGVDTLDAHRRWAAELEAASGRPVGFPLVCDPERAIARRYDMLAAPSEADGAGTTARSLFIVAPDRTVRLAMTYPARTARSFGEVLRALDSCQLTARHRVATPADWRPGEEVIILPEGTSE